MGWHYELVKNGEDLSDISRAIDKAKEAKDKPSIIEVKTKIGFGSSNEGNNSVHGKPLNEEDIISLKTKLRIPNEAFYIDEEGKNYLIEKIKYRVDSIYTKWASNYNNYKLNEEEVFEKIINPLIKGELTENFTKLNLALPNGFKEEVRASNMRAINYFAKNNLSIVGGSADLSSSTKGYIGSDEIERMDSETPIGRNIYFGVREHAMGAILNGLALTGLRPFGSTFLSFADYLKPAIRMSALMNLPVTYIFTHDSIAVGPDGPTHQPIEQMAMLRSIPNFEVYRPADINETFGSWLTILNNKCPSALIINKGEMESLLNTNYEYVKYGAYMVKKETSKLDAILVATGKELKTAMNIANELLKENIDLRVVSMPSLNLYLKNTEDYKNALLPDWAKVIVIEAGSPYGWEGITGFNKIIGVDTFGYSGKPDDVLKKMSFDYESIKDKVKSLL